MDSSKNKPIDLFMRQGHKTFLPKPLKTQLIFGVILVFIGLALSTLPWLHRAENFFYDSYLRYRPTLKMHPGVVVVEIDSRSLEEIGNLPWPKHYYAEVIDILTEWRARSIVFDLSFEEAPSYEEERNFEKSVQESGKVYLPVSLEAKKEKKIWVHSLPVVITPESQGLEWNYADRKSLPFIKGQGHTNIELDSDGVFRRTSPFLANDGLVLPHLALRVAYDYLGETLPSQYRFPFPKDNQGKFMINWGAKWKKTFKHYSYTDLVRNYHLIKAGKKGIFSSEEFLDKICLIGITDNENSRKITTPFAPEEPSLSGQAHLLNSLLQNQFVYPVESKEKYVLLLVLGLGIVVLFLFISGIPAFILFVLFCLGWLVGSFFLFCLNGVYLPVAAGLLMGSSIFVYSIIYNQIVSKGEQTRLFDLATRDGLTGLYVIRHFREILNRVVKESLQTGEAISIILMDLDNFKPVNDTYGHQAGDYVLKQAAEVIFDSLRSKRKLDEVDYVGRYGGEEFIVLLRKAPLDSVAKLVAERIRKNIEEKEFEWEGTKIPVTVSVGVSGLGETEKIPDAMVRRADEALYEAKRTGKNKVSIRR